MAYSSITGKAGIIVIVFLCFLIYLLLIFYLGFEIAVIEKDVVF